MTDTPPASGPTDPNDRPPPPTKEITNEQNSKNQRSGEPEGSSTASEDDSPSAPNE